MNIYKFKTTINCGGCIKAVTPFLKKVVTIEKWSVDTESSNKILTVEGKNLQAEEVVAAIKQAGFEIEII